MAQHDHTKQQERPPVLVHGLGPIDLAPSADELDGARVKLAPTWLGEDIMTKLMDLVFRAYAGKADGINSLKEPESVRTSMPPSRQLGIGAKRALLTKHGFIGTDNKTIPSDEDVEALWSKLLDSSSSEKHEEAPGEADFTRQQQKMQMLLLDLVHTKKSNGNKLKWTIMDCLPGTKFQLHAHPNIELVYCLQGELHEVRMAGAPLTMIFDSKTKEDGSQVQVGPNLKDCKRSWYFDVLKEGHWSVNEVGSIHQSFTSSKQGCVLVALWSAHADIEDSMQPEGFRVASVIDNMVKKVCCSNGDSASFVGETFLPPSEKSSP
jgi:hypothetical protein